MIQYLLQFAICFLVVFISTMIALHESYARQFRLKADGFIHKSIWQIFGITQQIIVTLIFMLAHNALLYIGI